MSGITGILTTILVIGILVFFHELGHFLFAKLFRMKVEDFSLGFGPRIVRLFHDGQTEYNLRWLPIGGFVRISGMEIEDEAERRLTGANERKDGMTTTNAETMAQEAEEVSGIDPDGFNSRPIYQRFFVIAGGPAFSFLLGWLALCLMGVTFGLPTPKTATVIEQVMPGMPAAQAGLHDGDTVRSIDGHSLVDGIDMVNILHASPGKQLTLEVSDQKGDIRTVHVTPQAGPDPSGNGKSVGLIGIRPVTEMGPTKRTNISESFRVGNSLTALWFQTIAHLFQRPAELKDNVGGPIRIFKETTKASQQGGTSVIMLLGQLSLSLGLFNLFPIPILDGGHLALMALEAARRRKLTAEQTSRVFLVGAAVMVLTAVAVFFKDVAGLFAK